MTAFNKEQFSWDGMYLMYEGDQGEHTVRYEDDGRTHPSRVGTIRPMFIARFKYGSKPWKTWVNRIAKHYTVEQVAEAYARGDSPVDLMRATGYLDSQEKKLCDEYGYPRTVAGFEQAMQKYLDKMAAA